jgi:hypothetical protein
MKRILLLAIICWGLLAPLTYHPDTKLTLEYPALENGKVWDIYAYLANHKLNIPDFHYPPAHYWWLKIHYPISKFIGGNGFDKWLNSGSVQASFDVNSFRYNLAAKFPLLVLGILSGWMIFLIVKKWSKNESKARMAALFWFFNPVTLYSLVMMGQNDIVAIFLFLMGIWLIDRWWLTALLWGLAAGVKSYPIIWAIMFLLVWEKDIWKLAIKTASVVVVYGLILAPWLSKPFFTAAVLNSGLSQRMFVANMPIGFGKEILIVPLLLIFLGLNAFKNKKIKGVEGASLVIFQSSLVILGFSHFNPQWMMWTVPFFLIWGSISGFKKEDLLAWMLILVAWLGLLLGFDDKFLTWGIFSPINPNLLNYPSLVELLKNKNIDFSQAINICQSLLAGISLWYLTKKSSKELENKRKIKLNKNIIYIVWAGVLLLVLIISLVKIEIRNESGKPEKEVLLSEMANKTQTYNLGNNLKYLEISLDNPELNSQDKGILVVKDSKNNQIEKEFSGFNAEVDGWLRVDIPQNMANSNTFEIEAKEVVIKDGLLKLKIDNQGRWDINFYDRGRVPIKETDSKILSFWWWWLLLVGASLYFYQLKDK